MKFKVCKTDIVEHAVMRRYYHVEANSKEEAEQMVEEDEYDFYDSDIDVHASHHDNYEVEEA